MISYIRVGKLPYFSATVRQFGVDPERILKNVGLDPAVLDNPDNFISYAHYRQLLVEAVEATGCERFGLLISKMLGPQSLGVVGFSMQQSPDFGTALSVLSQFFHLHDQHGTITVDLLKDRFRVSHNIPDPEVPGSIQALDVSAAAGHNLFNTLMGENICALRYEFPYPRPADISAYAFLEAQELVFDTQNLGIVIDRKYLEAPIAHHDPNMANLLCEYMGTLDNRAGDVLANKIKLIVKDMLSTGECSLKAVAELFKITPRTLQNRLKHEHTSFHNIMEDVRKELALHYLRSSQMDLTKIALLIGYSDSSAFSRSFRRWYSKTPSKWRKSGEMYTSLLN